ncbi:hypothetical protein CANCADRAFT_46867 [Tortispora caseinolytica NRRL Y-17796]|uniref:non-specific serine/threonine protein kinase n=1 Tax=Tortispora caseinolytica NRRL Y-17796 TaxID=767744 RepID=A0A1E4TIV8_9ASCO|nr:hypothetical protein CANCADRAFT_46867 [Tortispora caseinolytica NRRL Y-17796]
MQKADDTALPETFQKLKSRNVAVRDKAADELLQQMRAAYREMPSEQFTRYNNEVNRNLFELIHSPDQKDRMGGIAAIDRLIEFDTGEESTTKITRYANYLRFVIPSTDLEAMRTAAKALGKLAAPSGTLTAEFVDFEVKRCMEWLQLDLQRDRDSIRRHASVLIIQALAENSPTLLYGYIPQILDLLWVGLRDPKVNVRNDAALALQECLDIIYQRDSTLRRQWFQRILDEAYKGLNSSSPDSIHGSLLAFNQLLIKGGMFMHDKYDEVCEIVLGLKDYRDVLVRRTVISMIPILASYNPTEFVNTYLHRCMLYLLAQLKKDRDRNLAFCSIGRVATSVRSNMGPYLDAILVHIKDGLAAKDKTRKEHEPAIFECISLLAEAVGQVLIKHMHRDILDLIFASGLSDSLLKILMDLSRYIPPLLPTIQDRLLNTISFLLSGYPFRPSGSPDSDKPMNPQLAHEAREASLSRDGNDMSEAQLIALAMRILGSFDFKGHVLNEFVRSCAISYINHDNPEVRRQTALTCCSLFLKDPICFQTSAYALSAVEQVLGKLLALSVADPVPEIRLQVIQSFDSRFDPHISQASNVALLFLAFNDELFAVREAAIRIIGRLTLINPAYIMPSLRKILIQLLTKIEYSTTSREKEESAKLLSILVSLTSSLTKPYVKPMIKVLLPKARERGTGVSSTIISCIGELSKSGGEDMLPYVSDIMQLILENFQDQGSQAKRDAALRTLGQLASSSGYVIDPIIDYPQLISILITILRSDQSINTRRETVKLIGILGALDPYKYQMLVSGSDDHIPDQAAATADVSLLMAGMNPSSDDYYPTVVIHTLMNILRDPSLGAHHTAVIQAIMYIFKALGLQCVPFLPQIIPNVIAVMRSCNSSMLEFYFQQMSELIKIVKQHIRPFLPQIFMLIRDIYDPAYNVEISPSLEIAMFGMVEAVARALDGEFKLHLPTILPHMLAVLEKDDSSQKNTTQKVLHAFTVFGSTIEEFTNLIIPNIIRLTETSSNSVRISALRSITLISKNVNLTDLLSLIIHAILRVIQSANDDVRSIALDTLCALIYQSGQIETRIFLPVINKTLMSRRIYHPLYTVLSNHVLNGEALPDDIESRIPGFISTEQEDITVAEVPSKKLPVNQQHLKATWDASQQSTKEDWLEWMRRLCVELLKESPSHALRACAGLASVYFPLAKELFNASFASCWSELYEKYQSELVQSLETALMSPNIPPETLQTLLNLAEFMEHDDKALPIDIRTFGQYAQRCHAYAKALHYKEIEFIQEPTTATIESLISINNQLQQSDAAVGILKHAQRHHDLQLKETWYEKLQRWDDALEAYDRREKEEPGSIEVTMGKMRCLHALGEWEQLSQLAQEKWIGSSNDIRRTIAPLAAAAAWGLKEWEKMDSYIGMMKPDSPDRAFFTAIYLVHENQFDDAKSHIFKARDLLITELTALVSESYNRAYSVIVRVQMLAELEEIIAYKNMPRDSDQQRVMRKTWTKRLMGSQKNVDIRQRMLKIRSLVINPEEDSHNWIKFANLCRKSGRLGLAEKTLQSISIVPYNRENIEEFALATPNVLYSQLKYDWATEDKEKVLNRMSEFTRILASDIDGQNASEKRASSTRLGTSMTALDRQKLLSRCCVKQGEWKVALNPDWQKDEVIAQDVLNSYWHATKYDPDWYKAWHNWALTNFEVVSNYDHLSKKERDDLMTLDHALLFVVQAIEGFFKSIALSEGNSLQDTLRLLTLWFKYGGLQQPAQAINEGFSSISIDTWLEVIPQLITRIHQPNPMVRRSLHRLLTELGRVHPQALVYPLTVAIKSDSISRQKAAMSIIEKMKQHSPRLVEQAELVSHELIRVAVLWHEQWHEGLETASRFFFGDNNIEKMFATLEPLHKMLERGPETLREVSFHTAFGRDLRDAYQWTQSFKRKKDIGQLNQAWDIYYSVFRRISRQLPQLQSLDLQYVSPKLLACRDLDIAVPGTYQSGKPVIRIMKIDPIFTVISSKQRPRRLTIQGSDGKDYQYLLKGHEDIRQDGLVMQLFSLVNTILAEDSECFKRHLNIQRYPVIPLSPKSGLLGWVQDSDTFHVLIREYRENRKIMLNLEHRIMLQMAPDYDNLTLLQKVEVFTYALDYTSGQDLYRVLWLKSRSSEAWLDRRTTYTRSLAVMSMVGYILGLGDRHPSNLMLNRYTGKVIHIDFGDCFEAAILREKYPEKVPFRLTRMLTYAMEVSGIEGSFRITCENVMRVLRDNKESLMAILEAFAHDPLINWGFELPPNVDIPRRPTVDENELVALDLQNRNESRNARATVVLNRITDKLTGNDFKHSSNLDVPTQVDKLIQQATSVENLCQHFIGWCSFW